MTITWYSSLEGVEPNLPGAVGAHHRVGHRHEMLGLAKPVVGDLALLTSLL